MRVYPGVKPTEKGSTTFLALEFPKKSTKRILKRKERKRDVERKRL